MNKRLFSTLDDNHERAEIWEALDRIATAFDGGASVGLGVPQIINVASDVTTNPNSQDGSVNRPFGTLAQARSAAISIASESKWAFIQAIGNFTEGFIAAPYIKLQGQGPYVTRIIPPELEMVSIGVANFHMEGLSIETASSNPHWLLHTRLGGVSDTCTFTLDDSSIACASHGFSADDQIYFTSTGSLPTNINAGTWYRVIAVDSGHFRVSLTSSNDPLGVVAITPTGSQSGVHTVVKDTLMTVGTWLPNIVFRNIRVSNPNGIAIGTCTARTYGLVVDDSITGMSRNVSGQHLTHKIVGTKYGVKDSMGLSENNSQPENSMFAPVFLSGEITSLSTTDGWAIRGTREDPDGDMSYDTNDISWIPTLVSGGIINAGRVIVDSPASTAPAILGIVDVISAGVKADLVSTPRIFGENATSFASCNSRFTSVYISCQNNRSMEVLRIGNTAIAGGSVVLPGFGDLVFAINELTGNRRGPNEAATVADGDTVTIATNTFGAAAATVVYRFKDTMSQAYDVQRSAIALTCFENLKKAVNGTGVAGTHYFAGTVAHPSVVAEHIYQRGDLGVAEITMVFRANLVGVRGLTLTASEVGTNLAWSSPNFLIKGVEIQTNGVVSGTQSENDITNITNPSSHRRLFAVTKAAGTTGHLGFNAPRRALLLRNRDQYAQLPLGAHADLYTTRTVEMWVRMPVWAYGNQVLHLNEENIGLIAALSGAREFYLAAQRVSNANAEILNSRQVYGGFQGGAVGYTRTSGAGAADNAMDQLFADGVGPYGDHFHHIAVTLSVVTQQLFINGVACGATAVGQLIDASHRLVIGGFTDSTTDDTAVDFRFNGLIRGVRFSSTAHTITPTTLPRRFRVESDTLACWDGDGVGSVLSWADKFSGFNDAEIIGGVWVPDDFTP